MLQEGFAPPTFTHYGRRFLFGSLYNWAIGAYIMRLIYITRSRQP